jgi:hypothetical protein
MHFCVILCGSACLAHFLPRVEDQSHTFFLDWTHNQLWIHVQQSCLKKIEYWGQ